MKMLLNYGLKETRAAQQVPTIATADWLRERADHRGLTNRQLVVYRLLFLRFLDRLEVFAELHNGYHHSRTVRYGGIDVTLPHSN